MLGALYSTFAVNVPLAAVAPEARLMVEVEEPLPGMFAGERAVAVNFAAPAPEIVTEEPFEVPPVLLIEIPVPVGSAAFCSNPPKLTELTDVTSVGFIAAAADVIATAWMPTKGLTPLVAVVTKLMFNRSLTESG